MARSAKNIKVGLQNLDFFAISCFRLYIFSVISCGLYGLYWAYRNWKCIQNNQASLGEKPISPVWRGWLLGIVWFLPLSMKIVERYKASLGKYLLFSILYLVCFCGMFFCIRDAFPFVLLLMITPLFLLPFQGLINKNTSVQKQKLTRWDMLICLTGFLLMFLMPVFYRATGMQAILRLDQEQQNSFFAASGIIYRYTTIYGDVCQEFGVDMKQYQQDFQNEFNEDIGLINQILKKTGLSFPEFMSLMLEPQDKQEAVQTVRQEIENMRKFFILQMLSAQQKHAEPYDTWDDSYDGYMTLAETCSFINKHESDFMKLMGVDKLLKSYTNSL